MRKPLTLLLTLALILLAFAPIDARTKYHNADYTYNYSYNHDEGELDIDFKGSTLVITCDYDDYDIVEINASYEMYVNDKQIELDAEEQKLVKEFYDETRDIQRTVKRVAAEGAKLGLKGAKLGLQAIGGLFKAALTSYTTDDLERDMEWAAKRLEDEAEDLERMARRIEKRVDNLEEIGLELTDRIPELQEIECFW